MGQCDNLELRNYSHHELEEGFDSHFTLYIHYPTHIDASALCILKLHLTFYLPMFSKQHFSTKPTCVEKKKEGIKYMMCSETHLTLLLASSKKNNRELKLKQDDFISPGGNPRMIQCRK